MRTPFSVLLGSLAAVWIMGCEAQPVGGRCESNFDCDRSTNPTTVCRSKTVIGGGCSSGADCICCPADITRLTTTEFNALPTACKGTVSDGGVTDAGELSDASSDASDASDAGTDVQDVMSIDSSLTCNNACGPDQYCMVSGGTGTCRLKLPNGGACTSDTQCQLGFCANGYCCNSRCSTAGYRCDIDPMQGLCSLAPTDAGTADTGSPDARD